MKKRKTESRGGEEASDAAPRLWRERRAVLIVAALALLALIVAFAGASAGIAVPRLAVEGLFIALWLAAAAGFGGVLLRGPQDRLRGVTTVAMGLGVLSLLQLGLGLAGLLHRWTAFTVVLLGLALLAFHCRRIRWADVKAWLSAPADWEWLWLFVLPPLAMALVAALVPPGVLWGDEPHGYDVIEYHLQLPREFYELGGIAPLHHNVFSYFPLGMEMQYLLAMQLRGGPWAGMYLAQLMHVATCALSVLAVYAAARQFAPKLHATLAAVAMANVPWIGLLAPVAYNEGALLLFGTLAIAWVLRDSRTDWLIGGVMTGFACGVKLTAVPQVLLLVPVLALVRRRAVANAAVFVLAGVVMFSPWLIRNAVWTRNPVFPEAQNVLGRGHFSETQSKRWHDAHSPPPAQRPIAARLRAAGNQILFDWRFGWALLPLGVTCAAVAIRRPEAKFLLILLLAWLIFWLALTHLQGRFFVPAIAVAAMCVALAQGARQVVFAAFGTLMVIIAGLTIGVTTFSDRVGLWRDRQLLAFGDFKQLLPEDVALHVEKGGPLALVGDARAFWYPLPSPQLRYRTVFDVDAKPGQTVVEAWLDGQTGAPNVVIDPIEIDRFSKTYFGIPPLPPDLPGPRDHAFVLTPQAPSR